MTNNDNPNKRKRPMVTPDHVVQKETSFHAACFRFTSTITSLRIAMSFADKALSKSVMLEGEFTYEKAHDLHARWAAASRVMHESLECLARDGSAMIDAMLELNAED